MDQSNHQHYSKCTSGSQTREKSKNPSRYQKNSDHVKITFTDDGIGIPKSIQSKNL